MLQNAQLKKLVNMKHSPLLLVNRLVADVWYKRTLELPGVFLGVRFCLGNEGEEGKNLMSKLGLEVPDIL